MLSEMAGIVGAVGGVLIANEILCMNLKNKKTKKAKIENYRSLKHRWKNGLKISENIQLDKEIDFEGSVIIAPTGAGKTSSFHYNNLLSNDLRGSIIVMDLKGELYRDTRNYQKDICRRKVIKFNPLSRDTAKYNLLKECKSIRDIKLLASSLLINGALQEELKSGKKSNNVEWLQMSESLLVAALIYMHEEEVENTIEKAFELLITLNLEQLDIVLGQSTNREVKKHYKAFRCVGEAEGTIAGIKVTLAASLKVFLDNDVNYCLSKSDFNFEEMREEETILYVTISEEISDYLSPVTGAFLQQMLSKFIGSYRKESLDIHLLLDEFCNCGYINSLSKYVSLVRYKKISINICIQSISQMIELYGENNTRNILNNLKTKIILPGITDIETLNYIKNICGNIEVKNKENISIKPMFEINEIRCLEERKMIIIASNNNPIIDKQKRYYECDEYKERIII